MSIATKQSKMLQVKEAGPKGRLWQGPQQGAKTFGKRWRSSVYGSAGGAAPMGEKERE